MRTLNARQICFKQTVAAPFINSIITKLHACWTIFFKVINFLLTQTMSTDAVQLIKNVQIESVNIYRQFVKMTEHENMLWPLQQNQRELQDSPHEAPTIQKNLPKERQLSRPSCKLNFGRGTTAETLR